MSIQKRLPTAIGLLFLVFLVVEYLPSYALFILLQVFILASLYEYYNLVQKRRLFPREMMGIVIALIISASFILNGFSIGFALFISLLFCGLYYVIFINTLEKLPLFPSSISVTFFGAVYLSFTLNHLYLLKVEYGRFFIYFLAAVVFMGDTGAYLCGKLMGKKKIFPIASPRKTWEGSVGGIIFACAGGLVARKILLENFPVQEAIICSVLVHAVAQISDPLESLFKRAVGVKDSSRILPGHGGFLDRVDSLILAAPFFYYWMKILGK